MISWLFGCRHEHVSWPLSVLDGERVECYRVCLECGKEMPFDLRFFKVTEDDRYKPRRRQLEQKILESEQ